MKVQLSQSQLNGKISAPPSKSCMHRALMCAAASDKPTRIKCDAFSKDTEATMNCLKALGAEFQIDGEYVTVFPIDKNNEEECVLDCNESGSTLRFLLPVLSALGCGATFTGSGRLPERPMGLIVDLLKEQLRQRV